MALFFATFSASLLLALPTLGAAPSRVETLQVTLEH